MHYTDARNVPKELKGNNRKHKVIIKATEDGRAFLRTNPLWQGGTKEEYAFFRKDSDRWVRVARDEAGQVTTAQTEDGRDMIVFGQSFENITLRSGYVCVIDGYFCGRRAHLTIVGDAETLKGII